MKLLSFTLIPFLITAGILYISDSDENKAVIFDSKIIHNISFEETSYSDYIEFNNYDLNLKYEVIQYQIIFHENDTVAVSSKMYAYYLDESITSAFCLLTDGNKPLLDRVGGPVYVPDRRFTIITSKKRFAIGKFRIIEFLNEHQGIIRVGSPWKANGTYSVKKGDRWYLTLAVPSSGEKTEYSISIGSQKKSMELIELTRNNNLGFYSVNFNQFFGTYYAIKFSWLGGFSFCDVYQEISTKNGSIFELRVAGHLNGNLKVKDPDEKVKIIDQRGVINFNYYGNLTGSWRFDVEAFSIYFIVYVSLLYIDINPYLNVRN